MHVFLYRLVLLLYLVLMLFPPVSYVKDLNCLVVERHYTNKIVLPGLESNISRQECQYQTLNHIQGLFSYTPSCSASFQYLQLAVMQWLGKEMNFHTVLLGFR